MSRENWLTRTIEAGIPVYGVSRPGPCALEDDELKTFWTQLQKRSPQLRAISLHIKNEGQRKGKQITSDKLKGVLTKGACDILIPGLPTLMIELKCQNHQQSHIDPAQVTFILGVRRLGGEAVVALGWEAAIQAVEEWVTNYQVDCGWQMGIPE